MQKKIAAGRAKEEEKMEVPWLWIDCNQKELESENIFN